MDSSLVCKALYSGITPSILGLAELSRPMCSAFKFSGLPYSTNGDEQK